MTSLNYQERIPVSVEMADREALDEIGRSAMPPINLQCLVRLAVRSRFDEHAPKRLMLSIEHLP